MSVAHSESVNRAAKGPFSAGEELGIYSAGTAAWFDQDISMGGRILVDYGSPTRILHVNNLGTTTVTNDQTGAELQDELFYPWGQDWTRAGQPYVMHFAGMGFESPDQLYLTDFRKYNSALGRWMSPDPLGGNVTDPQSLNRYGYVTNNPTTLTDPSGLGPCDPFDPLDCGPPTCDAFDFEGCQNGCNPAWANNCVLYCYELGTCNGRNGGGGGGSSGGAGGGAPPPPPSAPPAGQPPLRGGASGWIGPFTMDPVVVFPHSIPGGIYIGPWIIFVDSKGHVSTVNGQVLVAGGGAALLAALQLMNHGYYFNPLDQATDPYHPGQLSFRQVSRVLCSTHLTVDQATGTVGSHTDTVNPVPLLPGIGPFAWPVTFGGHVVADMKGIVPASQVCQ